MLRNLRETWSVPRTAVVVSLSLIATAIAGGWLTQAGRLQGGAVRAPVHSARLSCKRRPAFSPIGVHSDRQVQVSASFPWPASGRISRATRQQLTPLSSQQVLDEVAVLCTESIFEPANAGLSSSIQTYVYKKLIERYGTSNTEPNALFLATGSDGQVVGVIGVEVVPLTTEGQSKGEGVEERPLLEFLSVDPSARGKGLGKSLIKRVESQVREWGYGEVILQVAADNEVAIRLYEKMGYKTTAEDSTILRPKNAGFFGGMSFEPYPHLCMRKELGGSSLLSGLSFPNIFG